MFKKLTYALATLSLLLAPILTVSYASADASQVAVCEGIGLTSSANNGCVEDNSSPSVTRVVHQVISILSYLIGALSIVMIIVSGFRYITSGGDSAKVTSAKNTLMYALIGVAITAVAQGLVIFVFKSVTNTPQAKIQNGPITCNVGDVNCLQK